jgi:hypothetical protein
VKIELNVIGPAKSGKSRLIEILMWAIQLTDFPVDVEIREIRNGKYDGSNPQHVAAGRMIWNFRTGRVECESEEQLNSLR